MTVVAALRTMLEPDGAVSGTWLQAASMRNSTTGATTRVARRPRGIMNTLTILIPMYLAGQGEIAHRRSREGERGYAMAALIVSLAVLAVLMTAAMPVWKQMAQREKEEELVFRGEQYARAIGLFQRKTANAFPPNVDILVQQKFLRRKYKDPVTNDDFVPLTQAQQTGQRGGQAGQQGTPQQGRGPQPAGAAAPGGGTPVGGIIGVTSKSTDTSIRLYKGRSHYNEWAFVYTAPAAAPGAGGPGGGAPGQGRGQGQGRQGNQPPVFTPGGAQQPTRGTPRGQPATIFTTVPPGGGRGR